MIGNYSPTAPQPTAPAELVNGILPFATVATPGVVAWDLATYGTNGITAYASGLGTPAGQQYVTNLALAGPTSNVRLTASASLLANLESTRWSSLGAVTLSENSQTLTIGSGTILAANNTGNSSDDGHDHRRNGQLRHGGGRPVLALDHRCRRRTWRSSATSSARAA